MYIFKNKIFSSIFKFAYLMLVLGLVALPYFQYADGHIHVIAGEVIIHSHYVSDGNKTDSNPKNPGHRHSAAELIIITSLHGLHAYIADMTTDLVTQDYVISYLDYEETQTENVCKDSNSARAPPAFA